MYGGDGFLSAVSFSYCFYSHVYSQHHTALALSHVTPTVQPLSKLPTAVVKKIPKLSNKPE